MNIKKVCKNCFDFDNNKQTCTIRFTIQTDKTKTPTKRKPNQIACEVFMYK